MLWFLRCNLAPQYLLEMRGSFGCTGLLIRIVGFSVRIVQLNAGRALTVRLDNLHSGHHRVYCPYAFGAFYANIAEAFIFDVGGTGLALWLSQLTARQALWFTTLSVCKSVDDHCGYELPWDPFQWINGQTAAYHDIHHQSWGMKVSISNGLLAKPRLISVDELCPSLHHHLGQIARDTMDRR
jgi:hypothetical protein